MTGKQEAVMWAGLLLIAVRLFTTSQWSDIWAVILKGATKGGGTDVIPPPGPLLPEVPEIPEIPPILASAPTNKPRKTTPGSMSI